MFFLLRGLPATDWAGVLYEYLSIALAGMYSMASTGVNTGGFGWRSAGGGYKMDNQDLGLG
jgi:hypothetical protein